MQVDAAVSQVEQLKRIVRGLRNGLTLQDNVQCVILDIPDTGLANTELVVSHKLGKIPIIYIYNIDRNGVVYDSQRNLWTNVSLRIKCSVANAVLKLVVF